MKRLLLLALVAAAFCTAKAQTTTKLSATKANDYALVYSLPLTAVDITVEVSKTVSTPGEFYPFAKRLLNIDDPISQPSTTYKIENVVITSHGEPDPEQRYAVKFGSGTTPFILLSPDNLPLAINTEETYARPLVTMPQPRRAEATPLETPAARQVITEDMINATTPLRRAQAAAEQLYDVRERIRDLDSATPDLNAREAALYAMFTGTTKVSTEVRTFTFLPPADTTQVSNYVVARISPLEGLLPADDLAGEPITLNYVVTQQGEMPKNEKGVTLPFPKNGLAYCIPGKARITVAEQGHTLAQANLNVAQAGVVYGVAPNSFTDKKAPMYLIFDPSTGAAVEMGAK